MSEAVRVGVLVDGPRPPRWQSELATAIAAEPGFQLALLGLRARPPADHEPGLLRLYRAIDQRLHRGRLSAFAPDDGAAPAATVMPLGPDAPPDAPPDAASLRACRLDVSVDLTGRAPEPSVVAHARASWALAWGEDGDTVAPAGLGEMVARDPTTVVRLTALESGGACREIDRVTVATHAYSLVKGRATAVAACRAMVLRSLKRVACPPAPAPGEARPAGAAAGSRAGHPAAAPGNGRLVGPLLRFAGALAGRAVEKALWDEFHWSIAIAAAGRDEPPDTVLRHATFREIAPPRDRFYADPFLFEHARGTFLFLEVCPYRTGRGAIAVCRIEPDGAPGPMSVALERPHHLSYPCVFECRGEVFMLPEAFGTGTVELYRCERFPDVWVPDTVLMRDVTAADATVLEHDGRWWMFVCIAPPGLSPDTELHLFHADDVRGPWRPHRLNPVLSDVRTARPAGRVWRDGRGLIRPAQDCALRYGHGLSFRRITTLTPDAYAEEHVAYVDPEVAQWSPHARGIHTWNAAGGFCAVDTCTSRFRGERWLGGGGGR